MRRVVFLVAANFIFFLFCQGQQAAIEGYNIYFGHLHNHTGYSDGKETPAVAYAYARDSAGLDFFGLGDHVELLGRREYKRMKQAANTMNENNRFVTFYGFEWSSARFGHVLVVNAEKQIGSGMHYLFSFRHLMRKLKKQECVAFFNHPGRENKHGKEFDHFNREVSMKFVGMELWNKNKGFDVYYYNDGYDVSDDGKGYFDEALAKGWKIGAAGSEDNHGRNWGNMNDYNLAILSKKLTREDLYAALKERRFYSTLDKNLAMSFKINGNEMGSIIEGGSLKIEVVLKDTDGEVFKTVELLKNGNVVKKWTMNKAEPQISYTEEGVSGDYFYIRCKQEDGDEAISSPIFVENE